MAIDYDGSNTGLFDRAGKIIKYINSRLATATTSLPAELKAIADKFEAADLTQLITGIYGTYAGFQSAVTNQRTSLAAYVDAIFTDPALLAELQIFANDAASVMPHLIRAMIEDSESIDASTVSIGSTTPNGSNQGNGTVLLSKLLDGTSPPTASGQAILQYAGLNSELAVNETMQFVCIADSSRDGRTEGAEQFSWSGGIAGEKLGYAAEGSGSGPSLTVAGESNLVINGNFESWSGNTPIGWTVSAGTVGTHIKKTTAEYYRGAASLHFDGDGSQATIVINQSVSMRSRKLYCVSLRLKASASTGTGAFLCSFTGTGYTASSSEKIAISAGSMPTSWTLHSFWIVTPAVMPSDWKLVISNTGTPGGTSDVFVDCVTPVEGVYHGGLAAVVVPGSSPFAVGDRFTSAITNDQAGTFQEFFRQWYGVQLPSNGAGSETIADSLAT